MSEVSREDVEKRFLTWKSGNTFIVSEDLDEFLETYGWVLVDAGKWEKLKQLIKELERGKALLGGTSCLETVESYVLRVEKIVNGLERIINE